MEYDLIKLFEHQQLCLFELIPSTIVTFGVGDASECAIDVEWRRTANEAATETKLTLKWDVNALRTQLPLIDRQIRTRREHDDDRATHVEEAAVVVAVAVLALVEPATRFTRRSETGTRHDYYLNETHDEMIEIAGRWIGGLPGLFDEKRAQSDMNANLRKRWVSVTIARENARNRTEGLHS